MGLSVLLAGPKRYLVAADAEAVLRETTGGVAGLDDLLALLAGDLPFEQARPRSVETLPPDANGEAAVLLTLDGPKNTTVHVELDPARATPRRIVAFDAKGEPLISAEYDRFEQMLDAWMPTRVEVYVPAIDLTVEAKYRAFVPQVPSDFTTEPLESVIRTIVEKVPAG
jgi:hypothetical protein